MVMRQQGNAGMMPPSDSEEEEEEEEQVEPKIVIGGQSATAGMLPPNSSDEDEDEDEESEDDIDNDEQYQASGRRYKQPVVEEKTEKEIADEMERLKIVRERRAREAAQRIEKEGFDRYANPAEKGKESK